MPLAPVWGGGGGHHQAWHIHGELAGAGALSDQHAPSVDPGHGAVGEGKGGALLGRLYLAQYLTHIDSTYTENNGVSLVLPGGVQPLVLLSFSTWLVLNCTSGGIRGDPPPYTGGSESPTGNGLCTLRPLA